MGLPYFPMYPTDFEADTSHLTLEEDGAFNRLLRLMWMTPGCSLPDDDRWIMRRMRVDQPTYDRVVRVIIDEFMTQKGGRIFSKRLLEEWQKTDLAHRKRVEAGKMGGAGKHKKTKDKTPTKATPKLKQPEPEPEPIKGIGRFEEFWTVYPHRNGVKRKRKDAEKKFVAAVKSGVSQQEIIDGAIRSKQDKAVKDGFARDPVSWINQEGWRDEFGAAGADPEIDRFRKLAGAR